MQIEPACAANLLQELENEKADLLIRLAMHESHLSHLERPEDIQSTDLERNLLATYEQAGVVLPDAVLRRFEDVRVFSASISANRSVLLAEQIENHRERIASIIERMRAIDSRRRETLVLLSNDGVARAAALVAATARLVEKPLVC
jgi:uncharacterized protein YydD (DUF2326 family)